MSYFILRMFHVFQSTLSSQRVTEHIYSSKIHTAISIHTLLAESDPRGRVSARAGMRFQSTLSSQRVTRIPDVKAAFHSIFQSTLSSQRVTTVQRQNHSYPKISIHTLLAESDSGKLQPMHVPGDFNPHSPRRE